MSDPAKPLILILDPDQDFLDAMMTEGESRNVGLFTAPFTTRERSSLENTVMENYPDIVVLNLDQDDELSFADPVIEILKVPLPISPIIMGTTNRDAYALKQKAYKYGIDDYLIRPFGPREVWLRLDVLLRIRRLQQQLDQATRKLSALNAQLSHSNRHLEEMTLTDELTGLNNMRFMAQYLDKQFQLLDRYERPFSIMMIDLDHFKEVNDQNDHLVGSETIKKVGQVIQAATRGSDVKARYGGDEYIVAMPETDETSAIKVAERIRSAIAEQILEGSESNTFRITSSLGLATFDKNRHHSYRDLVKDADYALYTAKQKGRNRVEAFVATSAQNPPGYDESQSAVMSEIRKIEK